MWAINNVNNKTSPLQSIAFSDGLAVDAVRGGAGASFRLIINGFGFLYFTDTGHQAGGPHYWQLIINEQVYWYDGQGAIDLTINNDGRCVINGDGNSFSVCLKPLPVISENDVNSFNWMMENLYIPYQNIPDEPGKTKEELIKLGLQYFPYSSSSFQLAMSVYDWTTADFTRIDFMQIFSYTGVQNTPLDMDSIANGIWTANWPPYTPENKDYMNSFMMVPANSLEDVQSQLQLKAPSLFSHNEAEVAIIVAALQSMPRTSIMAIPKLYSGQVAIANLGTEHFASYYFELPANSDPSLPPLQMALDQALATFMAVGNSITLKTFMSFTDSFADAQKYSNGIVIIVRPLDNAVIWENVTYITPLSDGPDKTEYLFYPTTKFIVEDIKHVVVNSKNLVELYLQPLGS
jgi:hypothetical protein